MEVENERMTIQEAYRAMFRYLERQFELTKADEIGVLLGEMQLLEDGMPIDPGVWDEWLASVREAQAGMVNPKLQLKK